MENFLASTCYNDKPFIVMENFLASTCYNDKPFIVMENFLASTCYNDTIYSDKNVPCILRIPQDA